LKIIKIETKRLILREFVDSDFDNLFKLLNDPEVMKYCGGALNKERAKIWLQSAQRYYVQNGYDYWAAIEKKSGAFVGQIGMKKEKEVIFMANKVQLYYISTAKY